MKALQFHLSTAIILSMVAGGLLWLNFIEQETGIGVPFGSGYTWRLKGGEEIEAERPLLLARCWPMHYTVRHIYDEGRDSIYINASGIKPVLAIAINTGVACAILILVGAIQMLARKKMKLWHSKG